MLACPQANDWGRGYTCHEKNMAACDPWPFDCSCDGTVVSVDSVESELDIVLKSVTSLLSPGHLY